MFSHAGAGQRAVHLLPAPPGGAAARAQSIRVVGCGGGEGTGAGKAGQGCWEGWARVPGCQGLGGWAGVQAGRVQPTLANTALGVAGVITNTVAISSQLFLQCRRGGHHQLPQLWVPHCVRPGGASGQPDAAGGAVAGGGERGSCPVGFLGRRELDAYQHRSTASGTGHHDFAQLPVLCFPASTPRPTRM